MTPATAKLLEKLIRQARGMLSACEEWVAESKPKEPGDEGQTPVSRDRK